MPRVPTQAEAYSLLMEHLRKCQEQSAILMHLAQANDDTAIGMGWFKIQENFQRMQHVVTQLAMGKLLH